MGYITHGHIARMRMEVAGKKRSTTSDCCESQLLQAPCKLCRLNTINDFFSSAHKGKFCRATFWGWMILIWHSHSRSDFWHEWHSFVIYCAQGWSCAWPSSCYELTTRGGLWWPEWWLIHQKKIVKDPGKVFASFSTYNCPKSNGGVFDRSVWIITLWSCGYAKPFCLNGPPRQSLDIFEGKQKPG